MSEHSDNQYSYTKGMRLKLMHKQGKLPEPDAAAKPDLAKLCKAGRCLAEELEKFIYQPQEENSETLARDSQGEYKPSHDVRINKKWLKQFFKIDFYDQRQARHQRTHELHQFDYALQGIARWRAEWRKNLDELEQAYKSACHEQTRRSDIASLLLQLGQRDQFPLIQEFAAHARHKNKDNWLQDHAEAVEEQLQAALAEYAPKQGAGVVVAAASLNYYTVNKKSKAYYDDKISKAKEEYKQLASEYKEMKANKSEQKSRLLKRMQGERLILDQIQNDNELSLFHNAQDRDCLEEVYRLTREIKDLNEHQSRHSASTDHYRSLKGKLQSAKKERGFYFIKKTRGKHHDNYLQGWWSYCENYKKKAMDFGKVKAQLRGLEKERQESQQLRYWAVFLRRKERLSLCCIPLHKCREAWKFLQKMANTNAEPANLEAKLYRFHSITQRALHKLCFAEGSSFAESLGDLKPHLKAAKEASNDPEQIKKQQRKNSGQKTKVELELEFFQTLLKDSNATDSLELSRFDFSKALQAKNLDDFQMAFDKAGYDVETIAFNTAKAKTFVDRFKVLEFELTSYDLERRNENTHQTPVSNERRHTELWRQFWKAAEQGEAGDVRLNPELNIRLRKADPNLAEYLRKKHFDLEQTKHRRLQDQYNLHLTMELNAGRLHSDLAFAKADEIDARIDNFNETFNQQNWEKAWKYGIDRGDIELATLCLARFDKNDTYRHGNKTLLRPRFPQGEEDIKVYTLKREKYNHRAISELETRPIEERREKQVIVNISYFIDKIEDSEWFEQHTSTCIDLTTAKVISGKLVSNGDVLTFLKLKYEAAKRVLFDLVAQGKITKENKQLKWGSEKPENPENPASIELRYGKPDSEPEPETDEEAKKEAKKRTVYFFEDAQGRNFEGLKLSNGRTYTREKICEALQKYLNDLLREQAKPSGAANKHVPPIKKINHLRDALVANMVGVIMHLQQRYPGIVILEDLDTNLIQEHFQGLNINISRRLEFALYRKFQSLGKVPPHLKDLIERRERLHAKHKQEIDEAADKEYQKWLRKPKNKNASTSDKEKQKTGCWNQANAEIRKKKKFSSQIGAIVFVDKYKTSQNCPYCGESMKWKGKKDSEGKDITHKLKFEQHRFSCGKKPSCGFDTGHFKEIQYTEPPLAQPSQGGPTPDFKAFREIDDPDKVAAYNVAKKIEDWTEIARFSNVGEAHGKGQRRG